MVVNNVVGRMGLLPPRLFAASARDIQTRLEMLPINETKSDFVGLPAR